VQKALKQISASAAGYWAEIKANNFANKKQQCCHHERGIEFLQISNSFS
jgi:hypothetical protein